MKNVIICLICLFSMLMFNLPVMASTTNFVSYDGSDGDDDGVSSYEDNCPNESNPGQHDIDGDNIGDVCDSDTISGYISGFAKEDINVDISTCLDYTGDNCETTEILSSITTDAEGYYAFGGLGNGWYEIAPNDGRYVFVPPTAIVEVPNE